MKLRTRVAAVAVAGATAFASLTGPATAEETGDGSSINAELSSGEMNLSGYGGIAVVGALAAVVFLEGIVSVLNAPYCGANPDKCPNSLTASLSSGASSQLDNLRHQIPRVPVR